MNKINLQDEEQVEAVKRKQIKARARWFLECALDNMLAAYAGHGKEVERITLEMLDQMKG